MSEPEIKITIEERTIEELVANLENEEKALVSLFPKNQSPILLLGNPLLKSVSFTNLHSTLSFDNASANSFM